MPMHVQKVFTQASAAFTDTTPDGVFTLTQATVGRALDDQYSKHQVQLQGTSGDTFVVDIQVFGDTAWRTYNSAALAEDTVVLIDEVVVTAIRVTVSTINATTQLLLVSRAS